MPLYPLPLPQRVVFYYNIVSSTLWFCCLGRFLILLPLVGRRFLPAGIADFFHVVSVMPLLGFFLFHMLVRDQHEKKDLWRLLDGIRMCWVCYGVIFPHPIIAKHTSYSFLIASWCLLNLIDSCYYTFRIKTKSSPKFLYKLRHTHYLLTFPISFVSEFILVFLSLAFVQGALHEILLEALFLIYVPAGYFQLKYLNKRRREALLRFKKAAGH